MAEGAEQQVHRTEGRARRDGEDPRVTGPPRRDGSPTAMPAAKPTVPDRRLR
ncbi:hypothetical protein [Nonomuraea jabiensis]|uniref:Uncharacterized protein n=1 Tax=Nonomuraea jabiensis TaxID=882448 RepID=A0A7W9LEG8_9ACTN|nr:hypothetical protein [Nonomuraea jabiensis]MBB5780836.1 hypothetical protein [Nonomuraea jabiensis]